MLTLEIRTEPKNFNVLLLYTSCSNYDTNFRNTKQSAVMPQAEACVIDHGCLDPTKSIIGCIDNVNPCRKCKLDDNNMLSNLQNIN